MTEPKLPAEPTSTSQDVLVSHEYIDYVSALREAAEKALELAAEREVELERWKERHGNLYAAVVDSGCATNGDRFVKNLRAEAANARAEAAEALLKQAARYIDPTGSQDARQLCAAIDEAVKRG